MRELEIELLMLLRDSDAAVEELTHLWTSDATKRPRTGCCPCSRADMSAAPV